MSVASGRCPPSVRFLGRRVYVGAVVVLASAVALAAMTVGGAVRMRIPAMAITRFGHRDRSDVSLGSGLGRSGFLEFSGASG